VLHYYLTWVASDLCVFREKINFFCKFYKQKDLVCGVYESDANEQLEEFMECQSSGAFDMGDTHLQNSARVASDQFRRLRAGSV